MSEHPGFVVVMAAVVSLGCTNAVDEPHFKITTKRDNDKVDFRIERDKTVFSVHSPFGISQTDVERSNKNWPDTVTLRLHLKGLENFSVRNDKVTLEAAVSSHDNQQSVRQWQDGMVSMKFRSIGIHSNSIQRCQKKASVAKNIEPESSEVGSDHWNWMLR